MKPWSLERGAVVLDDGRTRFAVWAPFARTVAVRYGTGAEEALAPTSTGVFEAVTHRAPPGTDYHYRLDDRWDCPDPVSRHQPDGVHGPSRVVDPGRFVWSDSRWAGLEARQLVLYELHVGTFTAAGTFAGVLERIPELRELGVTAIELMPVAEFPGSRNWGYDGVHLYAPHGPYGGPEELRRLVDAAHAAGLGVVLDVVYNHLGPEGNYLSRFGPYFIEHHQTPWGNAVNFDGPDSDEVRRFVVDNALYWVTEFHVDGLRLDAVHAIIDLGAYHILAELADAVHRRAEALGRRVLVIAESSLNDPRLVRAPAQGGYGLDGQWNDDFHHAVHAALTRERLGYYVDFGDTADLAKALADRFVLDGRYSTFRRRRHGAPARDVPADRFVVAIQNHDQVGNRAAGDRLTTLVSFEQAKLAAALCLLSPYVPLLFMGEEYGETNPFLYFVSHGDPAIVQAVREGRRREFEDFAWQGEVPDPQAEATFLRSKLSWSWTAPERRGMRSLYEDLIRMRHARPALHPGAATISVSAGEPAGLVTLRYARSGHPELLVRFNVRDQPARVDNAGAGTAHWRVSLATADARYGGPGAALVKPGEEPALAPWSATCYEAVA